MTGGGEYSNTTFEEDEFGIVLLIFTTGQAMREVKWVEIAAAPISGKQMLHNTMIICSLL